MQRQPAVRRRPCRGRATRTPRWRIPVGGCATWVRSWRCRRCGWTTSRWRSPRACSACSSASCSSTGRTRASTIRRTAAVRWRPGDHRAHGCPPGGARARGGPAAGAGRHDDRGRCAGGRLLPGHEPAARAAVGDRTGAGVRRRGDFPTSIETHLLRVAVSQAAIAIHTARRLAREHAARSVAEAALLRQNELLRSLVDDVEPSLASIAGRIEDASRLLSEVDALRAGRNPRLIGLLRVQLPGERMSRPRGPPDPVDPPRDRDAGAARAGPEQQGIAGVMWLGGPARSSGASRGL